MIKTRTQCDVCPMIENPSGEGSDSQGLISAPGYGAMTAGGLARSTPFDLINHPKGLFLRLTMIG